MTDVTNIKEGIYEDLYRYAKLRGWFRSLPAEGKAYLIFPWRGQQPKNPINPCVDDRVGLHWWVWEADYIDELPINGIGKDIIMRRPFRFDCFLRGLDNDYLQGWGVICKNNPQVAGRVSATCG